MATSNPDGSHPRLFVVLDDASLEVLSVIFRLNEAVGHLPTCTYDININMFGKPLGGVRPIGFYRSLFRVWTQLAKPRVPSAGDMAWASVASAWAMAT